jgi:hypothetical protein
MDNLNQKIICFFCFVFQKAIQFIRKLAYNHGGSGGDPGSDLTKNFEKILPPLTFIDDEDHDHNGSQDPMTKSDQTK